MSARNWQQTVHALKRLTTRPFRHNDLLVTVVDALFAKHGTDWMMQPHRHPWYEFNYVAEGAVYTSIEGVEFRIEPGQSYLIPPGCSHSHRNADGAGDDGFCLRWQFAELPAADDDMPRIASQLIGAFREPRPYALDRRLSVPFLRISRATSDFAVQAAFVQWLSRLFDAWCDVGASAAPIADGQDALVQQVTLFMEEYFASPLKVQELADALHISYRSLSRRFKRQTGLSLIEKLNDIRISRAKKLLQETDMTLREIAAATGYDNEYYLSNQFHRYAMTTPGQYRKRSRGESGR
ncbi:AraC family transcriptional regulator [Paenibacillus cymbidii]|uniref:AraC family transcriptional regulator n=1 Tax=Paenibacillus cymbidii TaxID=1639034 RepID=UPI00108212F8|nr:AraC family transcriptional regulator [Paenibacillus cymbidii]